MPIDHPRDYATQTPPDSILSPVVAGVWRMADWQWTPQQRLAWVHACVDLGITTFDHADIYGDYRVEELFGEAIALAPPLRDRFRIVTKCGIRLVSTRRPEHRLKSYDTSAAHVTTSVETSLRSLHTDRIDVLLIHRPDMLMDADALARCFDELQRAGKVLHFGVSNHSPSQLAVLHRRFPLLTHQVELSPLQRRVLDDGTLDQCQDLGIAPMAWSPLGGGRLMTGDDEAAQRTRAALQRSAHEYGTSPTAIAYAWIRRHPSRPHPITGSRRVDVLRDAAAGAAIELDAATWYEIWAAAAGHEVP